MQSEVTTTTKQDKAAETCTLCKGEKKRQAKKWIATDDGEKYVDDVARGIIDCGHCKGSGIEPAKSLVEVLGKALDEARYLHGQAVTSISELKNSDHAEHTFVVVTIKQFEEAREALSRIRKTLAGAVEDLR